MASTNPLSPTSQSAHIAAPTICSDPMRTPSGGREVMRYAFAAVSYSQNTVASLSSGDCVRHTNSREPMRLATGDDIVHAKLVRHTDLLGQGAVA
jgi:hypothetical protein